MILRDAKVSKDKINYLSPGASHVHFRSSIEVGEPSGVQPSSPGSEGLQYCWVTVQPIEAADSFGQ